MLTVSAISWPLHSVRNFGAGSLLRLYQTQRLLRIQRTVEQSQHLIITISGDVARSVNFNESDHQFRLKVFYQKMALVNEVMGSF